MYIFGVIIIYAPNVMIISSQRTVHIIINEITIDYTNYFIFYHQNLKQNTILTCVL